MPRKPLQGHLLRELLEQQCVRTTSLGVNLIPVVDRLLERVGFSDIVERYCGDDGDVPVSKVATVYLHNRLAPEGPSPVYRFESWVAGTILPLTIRVAPEKLNEWRLARCLESLGRCDQAIWAELIVAVSRITDLELSLVAYDCSAIGFEGEYGQSELVQRGYNQDQKLYKQVVVGLNVTQPQGLPILYSINAGNRIDRTTVMSNVEAMRALYKKLGIDDSILTMVGDRGMLNSGLMDFYGQQHIHYIGALPDCTLNHTLIDSVRQDRLLASPLGYVAKRFKGANPARLEANAYFGVRVPFERYNQLTQKNEVVYGLVMLSTAQKALKAKAREELLNKAEARLREIAGYLNKGVRYKILTFARSQVDKALTHPMVKGLIDAEVTAVDGELVLAWHRNHCAIEEAAQDDGKYVVYFTQPALTDLQVLERIKGRDVVEKRIGLVKGPVQVRPVFLQKDDRIRGLVLCSMIALLAYSLMEDMLTKAGRPLTGAKLKEIFHRLEAPIQVFQDGSAFISSPTPDSTQAEVLQILGAQLLPPSVLFPEQITWLRESSQSRNFEDSG